MTIVFLAPGVLNTLNRITSPRSEHFNSSSAMYNTNKRNLNKHRQEKKKRIIKKITFNSLYVLEGFEMIVRVKQKISVVLCVYGRRTKSQEKC